MKNLLIIASIIASTYTYSQDNYKNIHLNGGINISSVNTSETGARYIGFNVGVAKRFAIVDQLFVETGVQYAKRGYGLMSPNVNQNGEDVGTSIANFEMNYIEVPVLIGYSLDNLHFQTGWQFAKYLNGKYTSSTINYDIDKNSVENINTGFIVGITYDIPVSENNYMLVGGRFNQNFSQLLNHSKNMSTVYLFVGFGL